MQLTRLAITRPVTILMLVLALVIMGLQSRSRLPVDLYPIKDFPMLFISTVYPGTGPEEIETLVTKPIEDSVSAIGGLKKLSSTSSEGISSIRMEFEIGTDLNDAAADVRSKLDALRNALPQDAKAPVLIKADIGAVPVISLSVSSDRRSPLELRSLADDKLKVQLSKIPGVAAVAVSGGDVREVRVEVDKSRLEAYGLSIAQVVSALKAENLNLPSGSIEEGRRTSAVRVMGEFTDPKQVSAVRIPNALGNPNLTISDVARVRDTVVKPNTHTRVNRASSIALSIQKQSDANTVKVVDAVRETLAELTGDRSLLGEGSGGHAAKKAEQNATASQGGGLPPDIRVSVAMDQSTFIKDTLHDVYQSLIEGALLAVLIVFLFLHSLRGTVIVGLAIPISMIATFLVMDILKFSINMMTMLGLSLSVGILVDDSIVVIENIHRHLRAGLSPREAAIKGRTEIGLAAMTITMVDVVVFVPIAFMGGMVGQFFRQFGIVVASATLCSLFISFTLTPMLASRWLKAHDEEEMEEMRQREHPGLYHRFTMRWEAFYGIIDRTYRAILAWSLDHRAAVISLGFMTMIASFAVSFQKPTGTQLLTGALIILPVLVSIFMVLYGARIGEHRRGDRALTALRVIFLVLSLLILLPATGLLVMQLVTQGVSGALVMGMLVCLTLLTGAILSMYGRALTFVLVLLVVGTMALGKVVSAPMLFPFLYVLAIGATGLAFSVSLPQVGVARRATPSRLLVGWAVALLAIAVFVPAKFAFEFSPKVDQRQFSISVEQDVGTSLPTTDATARMVEDALATEYPEAKTAFTSVGATGSSIFGGSGGGSDIAQISVELYDRDDPEKLTALHVSPLAQLLIKLRLLDSPLRSTDAVIAAVNKQFTGRPGVKITASEGSNMGPGGSPVSIEVSGMDMGRIQQVANQIADIVKRTEGTYSTELSWREGRPEFQALIDRDRAAQYGISVAQIASALRTSLEGDTSTKYRENGKEYDIRVFLPESQRSLVNQLPAMVVGSTASGQPVYLYEVVRLEAASGPTKIERVDRQRAVTVNSQLLGGYAVGNLQRQIDPEIAKLDLTGITVNWSGQAKMMAESSTNLFNALFLSIVLVFMLMAALFESVLAPLTIMLAVPQAMAGAMFALTFTHKSLSIVTMIGIIMLVGLVTKNAILLVDYTNTLRKEEGLDRRAALLHAGPTRLRPILMTTLAMIFGMLPTSIALSKGSEMRQPMAIAVTGGLILSMFLTLLMVPVFYELLDELGHRYVLLKEKIIRRTSM